MTVLGTLGDAVDELQDLAVAAVDWLERVTGAFTAVDLALLALAILIVAWMVAGLYASVNLGAIEILPLEHDDDSAADLLALTASFRQRLDKVGLPPPPAVPAGAPQADVIQAVEAAPLPQGAFVAKLLEILPTPPRPQQFRVSGTLLGVEPATRGVAERSPRCSISFWLQPMGAGIAKLGTVEPPCPTHEDALAHAAGAIYREIAKAAPDVFPPWARWENDEALETYASGCARRDEARWANARPSKDGMRDLSRAAALSPSNALAQLELGNLEELLGGFVDDGALTARLQATALRRYLTVGEQWPQIVEARFRASVLAGVLAGSYRTLGAPGPESDVQQALGLKVTKGEEFEKRLRQLSTRESRAARQMVRSWFTLVRDQRLRNPFEWRGQQRRTLNHTVRISRHCVAAHRLAGSAQESWPDWINYAQLLSRSLIVHVWHLVVGKRNISWQARYNAASFDALRLEGGWAFGAGATQRRALRNLRAAVRESAGELPFRWAQNDSDFAYFHTCGTGGTPSPRWLEIIDMLQHRGAGPNRAEDQQEPLRAALQAERWLSNVPALGPAPLRLPARAWGETAPRLAWCGVAVLTLLVGLAVWSMVGTVLELVALGAGAAIAVVLVFALIDGAGVVRDKSLFVEP
jgi:hypothetical protein